jgi:hypothetical protein
MAFQENRVRHWPSRDFEWLFGNRGDENVWYAATLRDQAILKIKAAHTLHLYVGDQTRAVVDPRRAQEILSAFERESDETERLD